MSCVLWCVPRAPPLALSRNLFRLICSFPAEVLETEHCLESCSSEWVVLRKDYVASLVPLFPTRQSKSKHLSVICRLSICLTSLRPSAIPHSLIYLPPVNLSSLSHLSTCHLSVIYFGSSYHLSICHLFLSQSIIYVSLSISIIHLLSIFSGYLSNTYHSFYSYHINHLSFYC